MDVLDQFDTEPDFCKSDGADEKAFQRLRTDEGNHFRLRAQAPKFGQDVGVEEVPFTASRRERERLRRREGEARCPDGAMPVKR